MHLDEISAYNFKNFMARNKVFGERHAMCNPRIEGLMQKMI
jgi:hypothetical protein